MITEPVPDVIEKIGWTGGEAITDGRSLVHYFRTTPDGRIAFGWGGGRIAMGTRLHGRTEVDPDVAAADHRHLLDYFPDLAGRRVTHAWGGPIDASPTHLPAVTSLPRSRAWVAAGYTGNGVGPTNMVGLTLASLALDRTRRPHPPRLRRPQDPPRPPRALPLDRRRSDPDRHRPQRAGGDGRPPAPAASLRLSPECRS